MSSTLDGAEITTSGGVHGSKVVLTASPLDVVDDIDWANLTDIGLASDNVSELHQAVDIHVSIQGDDHILDLKDEEDDYKDDDEAAVVEGFLTDDISSEAYVDDRVIVKEIESDGMDEKEDESEDDHNDATNSISQVGEESNMEKKDVRDGGVKKKKPKRKRSQQRKLSNNMHTRKCREKLNATYAKLLAVLPAPLYAEGEKAGHPRVIKHKAQILTHAIDSFRQLQIKNDQLEMELALASKRHMDAWINKVVSNADTIECALKSFMKLICMRREWKYAELWLPKECDPKLKASGRSTHLEYVSSLLSPGLEADETNRLTSYRQKSKLFQFAPRVGVPGRVFLSKRPEWLPQLNDPVAFPRAPFASRYSVQVTFAVPVIVDGKVAFCVEFYDTERREYDPQVLHLASEIAARIGKAFGSRP